jgi:mycothione reductase
MKQKLFRISFCLLIAVETLAFSMTGYQDMQDEDVVKYFDVIVVGSGAGTKFVRPVANKGLKVAVVEQEKLGGTCLNKGCIPSKMLIHVADLMTQIKKASRFYMTVDKVETQFQELVRYVSSVVDVESARIAPLYERHQNITFYHEHATFAGHQILKVGHEYISAPKIFLAVGVDTAIPSIEGLEGTPYMTYREALRNERLPKKLLVIGGGYIAAELGYFYGAMGSETHFFIRDRMLSREDSEIREEFEKVFAQQFCLHTQVQVKKVEYHDGVFTLFYEDAAGIEMRIEGDALLVATGMRPLTADLDLKLTGVKTDEQGYILVDDHLATTTPGIYAFGDCIGRYGFRHSANYEGEFLFKALFEQSEQGTMTYPAIPHAIFTHPQIASVGKTEDELKREGHPYRKGVCRYEQSAMGMAMRSEEGFVKLLFDNSSRELIGAHIIGEEASNMIHVLIAFMKMHATVEDIAGMVYVHPALPEVIRNAARQVQ